MIYLYRSLMYLGTRSSEQELTFNVQVNDSAHFGISAYLAFVAGAVVKSDILDFQDPIVAALIVDGSEPGIAHIGKPARGEDLVFARSKPGYLRAKRGDKCAIVGDIVRVSCLLYDLAVCISRDGSIKWLSSPSPSSCGRAGSPAATVWLESKREIEMQKRARKRVGWWRAKARFISVERGAIRPALGDRFDGSA